MDTPAAVRLNKTNTAGSDIAWGAYLGIAMIDADILDNSCTGGGCENEPRSCPHCNDGKPVSGDPDAGEPPPLVIGGSNRQLFVAKDVRVSGNSGFQGSTGGYYIDQPVTGHEYSDPWPGAGWLRLIGDDVKPWSQSSAIAGVIDTPVNHTAMRGCMDYHTWTADRIRVRNLIKPKHFLNPKPADAGGAAPTIASTKTTIDGNTVAAWSQGNHVSTSIVLGEVELDDNPSVANRSVFLALDTRLLYNATLELLIDQGDGIWRASGVGTEPMSVRNPSLGGTPKIVMQCGGAPQGSRLWSVSSFQLQMASTGTARFGMRLSGVHDAPIGSPVLQLRKVGAAVVGTGWDRMFAEPTPASQSYAQDAAEDTEDTKVEDDDKTGLLDAMDFKMKQMQAELASLRDQVQKSTTPIKTDDVQRAGVIWEKFVAQYGRRCADTAQERESRRAIFLANLVDIRAHNARNREFICYVCFSFCCSYM